jgi:leucyl-tRNA---protein transferase
MESALRYLTSPGPCGYLPQETWRLEYELVSEMTPAEYMERLLRGWRRFGCSLFRPRCPACTACQSLRVDAARFRPHRSQRRARKANEGAVGLRVGTPGVSRAKLDLYDRYHAFQTGAKGWPEHGRGDVAGFLHSFVDNPFPTQEWCYYLGNRLVGVGYVDDLPGGMSAIYFFYDPDERARALGIWNVLSLIEHAAARGVPHVYLGFHVDGCRSMEYKAHFAPNQVLGPDRRWHKFRN